MSAFETLNTEEERPKIRRLNKLPILVFVGLVVVLMTVVIWGLTGRNFNQGADTGETSGGAPASDFADDLKRSGPDGLIESPRQKQPPPKLLSDDPEPEEAADAPEKTEDWRDRLRREQEEAVLRLQHQQFLAGLQAQTEAIHSPIAVDVAEVAQRPSDPGTAGGGQTGQADDASGLADLLATAMGGGETGGAPAVRDPNGQGDKIAFLNQEISDAGYLPNTVMQQFSANELKRGSVIPAVLISGINSDLPGRITAQVSQNVYDSATGRRLLIPQGAKLFGRYDSRVAFGQSRVLVVWTDLIFPNGSTLQLGGMAGMDSNGQSGFSDRVDNHYLRTFGSAALVALLGAGIDMVAPQKTETGTVIDSITESLRKSTHSTFRQVASDTVSRNLDLQPTIKIRPGYAFNVLVEQDIIFPGTYR